MCVFSHSLFEYTDEQKTPCSIQTAERKKVPEIVYVDLNTTKPKMPSPRSHILNLLTSPVVWRAPKYQLQSRTKNKKKTHTHTLQSMCVCLCVLEQFFWTNFGQDAKGFTGAFWIVALLWELPAFPHACKAAAES